MERFEIDHPRNEASGLTHLGSRAIAEAQGWNEAFWIASDEGEAHQCVAALGRGADGWRVVPLRAEPAKRGRGKRTTDAEALARAGGWIYVFGSHFGAKSGPLEPARHWVARFNEGLVVAQDGELCGKVRVSRPAFLLHRLINDALRGSGVQLIERGDKVRDEVVAPARAAGREKGKKWRRRLRRGDHPLDIEAATFLPHGRLLLGLRYPCTRDGHPLLVEIDGIDRLFAGRRRRREVGLPQVTRVVFLGNVGSTDRPQGVRDLAQQGTRVHVLTGDLDSAAEESTIVADHPEAAGEPSSHYTFALPRSAAVELQADLVRRFDGASNVEGITVADDGTVWYVHDAERIVLERVPGPAERGAEGNAS